MSTSNQKSNSSVSKRKPTKRLDATKAARKAPKTHPKSSLNAKNSSLTLGSKKGSVKPSSSRNKAVSRSNARTSANTKPRSTVKKTLKVQPSTKPRTNSKVQARTSSTAPQNKAQGLSERMPTGVGRRVFVGAIAVAVVALVAVIAFIVMAHLPIFVINGIDATASEHVSAETIAKLANVQEGTTLLSVDFNEVSDNIKQNPWVKDVHISREFPSTLGISVEERQIEALVVIGTGQSVWAIGPDGIWIEPVQLDTSGTDVASAALARAQELGCLLIADVPASVDPAQGSATSDDTVMGVLTYQSELPSDITSQARVYYATSEGSISLILESGLEISLGSPEDINAKSQALTEIMATYPNQLTYINVRVASKPTYRKVPDGTTIANVGEIVASNASDAATTDASSSDNTDDTSSDDTSYEDDSSSSDDSEDTSSSGDSE